MKQNDFEIRLKSSVLRFPKEADLDSIVGNGNNPKIARFLRDRFPHPYTMESGRWLIDEANDVEENLVLVIEVEGVAAGVIGFHGNDQNDVNRYSSEIGYWLGEPYWGRGIMTEAVDALTTYGFDALGLKRIYASVYAPNTGSMRVLEKAGYELEGIMRASVFKNGKILDSHLYAKI